MGLQEQHLRTHCSWKALLQVPLVLPKYAHLLELQRCCFLSQLLTYLSRPLDHGMFISKPCAEHMLRNCLGKEGRKEGRKKKETIPPPSPRSQIPAQEPPSGLRPQLSCQSREHTGSKEPPGQTVPPPPPSSPASCSLVWRGNIARQHSAPPNGPFPCCLGQNGSWSGSGEKR